MKVSLLKTMILTVFGIIPMLGGCSADPALKAEGITGRFGDGAEDASAIAGPGGAPTEVPATRTPESTVPATAAPAPMEASTAPEISAADRGGEGVKAPSMASAGSNSEPSPISRAEEPVSKSANEDVTAQDQAVTPLPILGSSGDGGMGEGFAWYPIDSAEEWGEMAPLPMIISGVPRVDPTLTNPETSPQPSPETSFLTSPRPPRTGFGLEVSCGPSSRPETEGHRRLECSVQPVAKDRSTMVYRSAREMLRQFSFRSCPTSRVEEVLSPPHVQIPSIGFSIDEGYIAACITAFRDLTIADPATSALLGL